jgi:hypothetical protein
VWQPRDIMRGTGTSISSTELRVKRALTIFAIAMFAAVPVAGAQTLLTSSFGGTQATSFSGACPSGYCFGNGPTPVGTNGYTVTYTARVAADESSTPLLSGPGGYYGLGVNGEWNNVSYAATNGRSSIFLTFSAPVTSVGGIMNLSPTASSTPWLRAYNASNSVIAEYNLSEVGYGIWASGVNQGAYRGVSYAGGIAAIELEGGFAVTQDLEASRTVPEPSSVALIGVGIAGIAFLRRRQRRA